MRGKKTGGRTAGVPNRRTTDFAERMKALKCDPVEGLAMIAADSATDIALRARIFADLLPYLYPKRKMVEVSGPNGGAIRIDDEQMRDRLMRTLLPEMFTTGSGQART